MFRLKSSDENKGLESFRDSYYGFPGIGTSSSAAMEKEVVAKNEEVGSDEISLHARLGVQSVDDNPIYDVPRNSPVLEVEKKTEAQSVDGDQVYDVPRNSPVLEVEKKTEAQSVDGDQVYDVPRKSSVLEVEKKTEAQSVDGDQVYDVPWGSSIIAEAKKAEERLNGIKHIQFITAAKFDHHVVWSDKAAIYEDIEIEEEGIYEDIEVEGVTYKDIEIEEEIYDEIESQGVSAAEKESRFDQIASFLRVGKNKILNQFRSIGSFLAGFSIEKFSLAANNIRHSVSRVLSAAVGANLRTGQPDGRSDVMLYDIIDYVDADVKADFQFVHHIGYDKKVSDTYVDMNSSYVDMNLAIYAVVSKNGTARDNKKTSQKSNRHDDMTAVVIGAIDVLDEGRETRENSQSSHTSSLNDEFNPDAISGVLRDDSFQGLDFDTGDNIYENVDILTVQNDNQGLDIKNKFQARMQEDLVKKSAETGQLPFESNDVKLAGQLLLNSDVVDGNDCKKRYSAQTEELLVGSPQSYKSDDMLEQHGSGAKGFSK